MQAFGSLVEEKVQSDDGVMQGVATRPIDTEDMRAIGAFLKIGDVVLRELLSQVEADHIKLREIAHLSFSTFPIYLVQRVGKAGFSISARNAAHYTSEISQKSGDQNR